jgi:hypothetical protein
MSSFNSRLNPLSQIYSFLPVATHGKVDVTIAKVVAKTSHYAIANRN